MLNASASAMESPLVPGSSPIAASPISIRAGLADAAATSADLNHGLTQMFPSGGGERARAEPFFAGAGLVGSISDWPAALFRRSRIVLSHCNPGPDCGFQPKVFIGDTSVAVCGLIGTLMLAAISAANAAVALAAAFVWAFQAFQDRRQNCFVNTGGSPSLKAASPGLEPFVSIHVATYNEPPLLVMRTLRSLAALDYSQFEVVVIDNNTDDPNVWRPIKAYVARLGVKFKFMHFMGVQGAKAGALNIALDYSESRTKYVAVVDADYQVSPDFLRRAIPYLTDDVRFVQFPQAYRQAGGAEFLSSELGDYFRTFSIAANRADASLLTGTLSVIDVEALRAVGGWPTGSITEDAALGLGLLRYGYRGRYIDSVVGRGLLPLDLAGLRTQRRRWAAGNMQVLLSMLKPGGIEVAPGARAAIFGQLTAWTGFLAVPLGALAVDAIARLSAGSGGLTWRPVWEIMEDAALAGMIATLACVALRSLSSAKPATMLVSASLLWTSSLGWLPALVRRPLTFRRTPKGFTERRMRLSLDLVGSAAALAVAAAFLEVGRPGIAAVLALSASGVVTGPFVNRALRRAAPGAEGVQCPA